LVQRIMELQAEPVAVLGAPSLFVRLIDEGHSARLFDRNPHLISALRLSGYGNITECDLFNYEPTHAGFSSVVADPPWYMDHYRAFLEVSRKLLSPHGWLLLSVLPRLTRPFAESDRLEIVSFAKNRGFDLIETQPGKLEYVSPPFEC